MSNVISASLAGLNGAVQQFEAAAARIAGPPAGPAVSGPGAPPLDSVEVAGTRARGGDIGALVVAAAARYSFDANAKALTIVSQTQNSMLDIRI